jgi:hypothetical protein
LSSEEELMAQFSTVRAVKTKEIGNRWRKAK